nr:hypothetical protein [Tanacetum cinerariifolium]
FQDILDAEKAGEEVDQSYVLLPVWSSVGSTNPQNNAEDVAFDGKEHDFNVKKPESKIILSPSSSALMHWERGKTTWGGRVEAMGIVPVCVCAQESWGEGTGVLAGKLGKIAIRVHWCRPIRKEEIASWDGGKSTWGGRVRVFGTVPVCVRVQERAREGVVVFGGKRSCSYCLGS